MQKQEDIKNEEITVTYSYWDGKGHRRQVNILMFELCADHKLL